MIDRITAEACRETTGAQGSPAFAVRGGLSVKRSARAGGLR